MRGRAILRAAIPGLKPELAFSSLILFMVEWSSQVLVDTSFRRRGSRFKFIRTDSA
jgi:hypothetical protein